MSSLQQTNRFLQFTNNSQRIQLTPSQGGFSQSLSGSETDVSTSNENLSNEERYVIRHTARQEPQGQENLSSNRSSLDVSSSSYNTLIIHSAGDEPWTGRLSGIRDHQDGNDSNTPSYRNSHMYSGSPVADIAKTKMGSHSPSPSIGTTGRAPSTNRVFEPSVREITDIPDDYLSQSQVLKHLAKEVKVIPSVGDNSGRDSSISLLDDYGCDVEKNMTDHFRRISINRKEPSNLGHEDFDYDMGTLVPSSEYSKWPEPSYQPPVVHRLKPGSHFGRKVKKPCLSRSQPDLSRIDTLKAEMDDSVPKVIFAGPRPKTSGQEKINDSNRKEVCPPAEMVEILLKENSSLKLELEACYQKVSKTQKLEQEIGKIHRAHEDIVQSSERREHLERVARTRLQNECRRLQAEYRRLQEINTALRDQLDSLTMQHLALGAQSDISNTDDLRRELNKREILVAQLITQNKELVANKERQEIELAAQRATLQEQRTHIDILDTALTNAQGNVFRLEEECRKKQVYVERVGQLQRALQTLQSANDRREQTERKLRLQLEKELHNERARARGQTEDRDGNIGTRASGIRNGHIQEETTAELKRQLREKEEKIMGLEGEVAKWEQRYLEESALRQAAIDAASIPKDAKIAALEKTSQETEKLIAEARSEKIRHMDEAHAAQKKLADSESRIKDLESKLAEKDAMIKVLQKHTYEKDVSSSSSYPSMLVRSPHHTPHPSLHSNSDLGTVLGTSVSRENLDPVSTTSVFSTVSSVLTSSCSTGISSYASSETPSSKLGSYHSGFGAGSRSKYGSVTLNNKSFDESNKSLDDQLKELDSQLDSQLLSKRGLCCFPGFTNTSTSPRKGKIPKPLLASVGVGDHLFLMPSRGYEQGRPEEIMLLEKQGRSSQQQRMQETQCGARNRSGSLPPPSPGPSSLPRPRPRTQKSPGKLGEYGRLGDGDLRKVAPTSRERDARMCSGIPPPKKLGEYGRLSDGEVDVRSRKKQVDTSTKSGRDSVASGSDDSNSRSKLRLFPGPRARRGSSLTRESKPISTDSSGSGKSVASTGTTKYRIHF